MSDRTSELAAALGKKLAKNRVSRERRAVKRQKTNPVAELHREWVSSMKSELGLVTVPAWAGAEYSLGKKLVGELGFEKAARLVRYFIETWSERKTAAQERRDEIPYMKLVWVLRARVLAEMEGAVSRPTSKRERVLRGEYDQASADASPMRGWGD
jgi:hypothetical protein